MAKNILSVFTRNSRNYFAKFRYSCCRTFRVHWFDTCGSGSPDQRSSVSDPDFIGLIPSFSVVLCLSLSLFSFPLSQTLKSLYIYSWLLLSLSPAPSLSRLLLSFAHSAHDLALFYGQFVFFQLSN